MSLDKIFREAKEHHKTGNFKEASILYRQILDNSPERDDVWHLMGILAHQNGKNELSVKLIDTAISLNSTEADFHNDLGRVYSALGNFTNADMEYRLAIEINPHHVKALSNLAGLLRMNGRFTSAVNCAKLAVLHGPEDPEAHNNLGNSLKDINLIDEAIVAYQKAIDLAPDYALAHWNISLALLSVEKFEAGFKEMMWRWKWSGFPVKPRSLKQPSLENLRHANDGFRDKRILLCAEQGLGDTIHFIRYAKLLKDRGAYVIFECPSELVPLLEKSNLVDEIVLSSNQNIQFDFHLFLLDLPYLFRTTLDNIPCTVPYLIVPDKVNDKWKKEVNISEKFKVGLNWEGNPDSPVERFRRISPTNFQPLSAVDQCVWFSLQKGPNHDNVRDFSGAFDVIDTGRDILVETAGLIQNLDLVITSDTAIAHLAGSLNKPVWILLHHAPDWRWKITGSESLWYPSARLFRQAQPGTWKTVIDEVLLCLENRT